MVCGSAVGRRLVWVCLATWCHRPPIAGDSLAASVVSMLIARVMALLIAMDDVERGCGTAWAEVVVGFRTGEEAHQVVEILGG
mmetsp:Transcript_12172/g.34502  ORF Transcript_12172/g.34502 Transcript_12172/m.34502 type:complete len:83 (+) Transcript_12172:2403-2651(+)